MNEGFPDIIRPITDEQLDRYAVILAERLNRIGQKPKPASGRRARIAHAAPGTTEGLIINAPSDETLHDEARRLTTILDAIAQFSVYGSDFQQAMTNRYFERTSHINATDFLASTMVLMDRQWISPVEIQTHMRGLSTFVLKKSLVMLHGLLSAEESAGPIQANIGNIFQLAETELTRRGYVWVADKPTDTTPDAPPTIHFIMAATSDISDPDQYY